MIQERRQGRRALHLAGDVRAAWRPCRSARKTGRPYRGRGICIMRREEETVFGWLYSMKNLRLRLLLYGQVCPQFHP